MNLDLRAWLRDWLLRHHNHHEPLAGDELDGCSFAELVRARDTRWTRNSEIESLLVPLVHELRERELLGGDRDGR